MTTERTADHWARWVRVLAVLCGVLLVFAIAEGYTIRAARAEIAGLRAERDKIAAGIATSWTKTPREEFVAAGRWLDRHISHQDYLRREGGLCGTGQPDFQAISDYMLAHYVTERAAGKSHDAGIEAMRQAMLNSDEWKKVQGK